MEVFQALRSLTANLADLAKTRIELASVEVSEHAQRYLNYGLMLLLAMFLLWMSIALSALLVIVLFWDTHRIEAVLGMACAFALSAILVGLRVRAAHAACPSPLAATLAELRKDIEALKNAAHTDG